MYMCGSSRHKKLLPTFRHLPNLPLILLDLARAHANCMEWDDGNVHVRNTELFNGNEIDCTTVITHSLCTTFYNSCYKLLDSSSNQNYAIINPQAIAIAPSLHSDFMSQRPSGLYIVNGIDPQTQFNYNTDTLLYTHRVKSVQHLQRYSVKQT